MKKLPKKFTELDLVVVGEHFTAPIVADLTIDSIGDDMDVVAAQMGYWGNVLGAAVYEVVMADARYRSWRANFGIAVAEDPKTKSLAAHKIKDLLEASPQFLEHKEAIAATKRNVTTLEKLFRSFETKGNQLQSRGAKERAVLEKTGIATKVKDDGAARNVQNRQESAARVRNVKKIISRTRTNK